MPDKKIALIEDDRFLRQQIIFALSKDYQIVEAGDRPAGELLVQKENPDLVLLDLQLPPNGTVEEGLSLLTKIHESIPDCVVIVMSGEAEMQATLKAVDAGAYDFFRKPFDFTELKLIMRRALEKQSMERENTRLREELEQKYSFENMIGSSPAMQRVYESIRRVAQSNTTVIIRGESGTGKELIARAIHYHSSRRKGPFVSVNCAAIPETLVESELFGHEKGSFTGATTAHIGKFEAADGTTMFMDEIGAVPLAVQSKLLRVLQERKYERLGGNRTIETDVRLITATNEDLEAKIRKGEFREDLYFRINVFPIVVPPLRERREDIPLLLDHFLKVYSKDRSSGPKRFDASAMDALVSYPWKGNVRELENMVQTLLLTVDSEFIKRDDLPSSVTCAVVAVPFVTDDSLPLDRAVENYERELIRAAIERANGVKSRAAEILGIDRNRMKYLTRKYNL
ncbi:sigma-54 dependent transcriptional regulator [bacterium]|nr:sigma-54 dependent transcriptional regulator [bacterium]